MERHKIFRETHEGVEALSSRILENDDKKYYYSLIAEEMNKGKSQLILTNDIMMGVALEYILNEKYQLINMNVDSEDLNKSLRKYIKKTKEDRAYLAIVISELNKDEYVNIHDMTLKKGKQAISFRSNGIVATNTSLDDKLMDCITRHYIGYVSND